jgi:hypothetical protein
MGTGKGNERASRVDRRGPNLKSAANAGQQIRRFHREPEKLLPREVKQWKASRNVA